MDAEVPRIEGLTVRNYRALRSLTLKDLALFTVLVGPNGSGKSTLFDVFAFLSECFVQGLRKALDRRGRIKELRSRGSTEPIGIELNYRERPYASGQPKTRLITYSIQIQQADGGPVVESERLSWTRSQGSGRPFHFLDFSRGKGTAVSGDVPGCGTDRVEIELDSPDILAVSTLGQFADHPRVSALRRFITGWYLSYLTPDSARSLPEAGPQERLTLSGDNLPNVIQWLKEQHPDRLQEILEKLTARIPRLESVTADMMPDGRLLLKLKDGPFEEPVLARFASDGTLKMLAYLLVLNDPAPPPFIGLEEPENHLHHSLLQELAEECRAATTQSQLMVTTHHPLFVNALKPDEVWFLARDADGFARCQHAKEVDGVEAHLESGAKLGNLWTEGFLGMADAGIR